MAVDAFIWFKNASVGSTPEGETTDDLFSREKAFEIKDFSFGVENPTTIGSATGGAGTGKARFNEFTIKRTIDKILTPAVQELLRRRTLRVGDHRDTQGRR
jgi:hypothetical protein